MIAGLSTLLQKVIIFAIDFQTFSSDATSPFQLSYAENKSKAYIKEGHHIVKLRSRRSMETGIACE